MTYNPAPAILPASVYAALLARLRAGQTMLALASDNPAPVASTRPPPVLRLVASNP